MKEAAIALMAIGIVGLVWTVINIKRNSKKISLSSILPPKLPPPPHPKQYREILNELEDAIEKHNQGRKEAERARLFVAQAKLNEMIDDILKQTP